MNTLLPAWLFTLAGLTAIGSGCGGGGRPGIDTRVPIGGVGASGGDLGGSTGGTTAGTGGLAAGGQAGSETAVGSGGIAPNPPGDGGVGGLGGAPVRSCNPAEVRKRFGLRIDHPAARPAPELSMVSAETFDVLGTLVEVMRSTAVCPAECGDSVPDYAPSCPPCSAGTVTSLRMTVEKQGGERWTVLVSPGNERLDSWVAAAGIGLNRPVSLRVRYRRGFQYGFSRGFVLNDDRGLLIAADAGPFVRALDPDDVPALRMQPGDAICKSAAVAWSRLFRAMRVSPTGAHGLPDTIVGLESDAEITLDARRYLIRNLGYHDVVEATATDIEEGNPWAIWHTP